ILSLNERAVDNLIFPGFTRNDPVHLRHGRQGRDGDAHDAAPVQDFLCRMIIAEGFVMNRFGQLRFFLSLFLRELALMLLLILVRPDAGFQDDFDFEKWVLVAFLCGERVLVAVIPISYVLIKRFVAGPTPGLPS